MAYTRVNWSDAPDTSTPINADNLNQMDTGIAGLDAEKVAPTDLLNYVYPVGSIYMSVNSVSPETFLGGTWERLIDRFLIGADDDNDITAGDTGGERSHTLTIDEMPSHTHIQDAHNHLTYKTWTFRIGTGTNNYATGTSADGFSGSGNYTDNATATNQNTGGGQAHNIMPPYLAVYMWKRTA